MSLFCLRAGDAVRDLGAVYLASRGGPRMVG